MMSAHVVVPSLDPASPATLSGAVLTTVLRDELGFAGVTFTDCLQMDAIARGTGTVRGGVLALVAGADALLVSHDLEIAHDLRAAIVAAVDAGDVPLARLEQAAARVLALRASVAGAAGVESATDSSDAPLAIARAAIALVRGNPRLDAAQPVTVVSFEGELADGIARSRSERPSLGLALRRRRYRAEVMRVPLEPDDGAVTLLIDVLRAQGKRALVVVARRAHLHPSQRTAIEALVAFARHAIVVSALEPFDVPVLEAAATLVCSFGDEAANVEALADVLAGTDDAHGTFPVALSSEPSRRLLTEAEIDARLPGRGRARSLAGDAPGDDAEAGGA
ncbi:MAG: hypothetical protein IAI48_02955 [Candidatus Eremiobacteraeota bacterium]|nr:hypothetical protein [Candidatus Eremiobacteraeota bacterium]